MTTPRKPFSTVFVSTVLTLTSLVALSGCAEMGMGRGSSDQPRSSDPFASSSSQDNLSYRANEFPDVVIPSELSWDREKSMIVRTDSFAGGVLQYSGRVDMASLSDFFTSNMGKNGWKLGGSAKYKNILLAFVKPNKTCTIVLYEDKLLMRTLVSIYVAEDTVAIRSGGGNQSNPFGSGM